MKNKTDSWVKYENGLSFFRKEKYLQECAKAERFYAGDHWYGLETLDLPKPIMPISKRVTDYKVSSVMAEDIKMNFSVEGYAEGAASPKSALYQEAVTLFNGYAETTWEEIKQRSLNEEMLLNAALSGIGVLHYYFDKDSKYGNDDGEMAQAPGRLRGQVIDGINLFLGDPNDRRINASGKPIQPYIIISDRKLVENVKETAIKNGLSASDIELISSDSDTIDQAFDKSRTELDDQSKLTVLLHYFVKNDTIWYKESCRAVEYVPAYDTGYSIYPIATMNWDIRKRFAYGMGEMKGQIPNQIAVNQLMAQAILSAQRTGTPKLIYNKALMEEPSNRVGVAIGVEGEVTNAARYLDTGHVSNDMYVLVDKVISITKDLAGANENALGEAKAENTSALMWAQKQSAIPLESIKRRFYQCQEDVGLIWVDIWKTKFNTTRAVTIKNKDGVAEVKNFNGSAYKDINMNLKIDIGASSQYSEITNLNLLNTWLDKQLISFVEYLERMPQGTVAKKQQLIDTRKQQEEQQLAMQKQQEEQMRMDQEMQAKKAVDFAKTLPEEVQQKIKEMGQEGLPYTIKLMQMQQDELAKTITEFMGGGVRK